MHMLTIHPHLQVRIARASVATFSTFIATNTWDVAPIVVSEVVSVTSELISLIPFFGNIMWMIFLFPTFSTVYYDVIIHGMHAKQMRELLQLQRLMLFLPLFMIVVSWIPAK